MKRLGAILAGGASRRFGSDKALAEIDGQPMLAHVVEQLGPQCDGLVIVGRDWPGLARIEDRPRPGMGPLGGLAGALAHARDRGFDSVLTSSCDLPALPADLSLILEEPDAVLRGQPTIGLWSVRHADRLATYLEEAEDLSMRGWIEAIGARRIDAGQEMANINTPADLSDFMRLRADPRSSR